MLQNKAKEILEELKQERLKRMVEEIQLYEKRVVGISRLIHMGLCSEEELQGWQVKHGVSILVDRKMLPKVKKCLARIRVHTKEVVFVDGVPDIHKICVVLESPDYPGVHVRYHRDLPEGSSCAVTKQTYPALDYFTLVCKPKE